MKPEIIIMLTNNDITVKNAEEVFESCKDLPAKKWGFKDVGLPKDEMIKLAAKMMERRHTSKLLRTQKKDA